MSGQRRETELAHRIVSLLGRRPLTDDGLERGAGLLGQLRDIKVLEEAVFRHKVPRLFGATLERLSGTTWAAHPRVGAILRHFASLPSLRRAAERREEIGANLREVVEALQGTSFDFVAIKGVAMSLLAPDYRARDLNDMDLLFRETPTLWRAAERIMALGYVVDRDESARLMSVGPARGEPVLAGHFCLRKVGSNLKADLHSYGLQFGRASVYGPQVFARARTVDLGGLPVKIPSREDAALVVMAHAAGHTYASQKDLNDLYQLVAPRLGEFDFDLLWREARAAGLGGFLAYGLRRLGEDYGLKVYVPRLGPVEAALAACLRRRWPTPEARVTWRGALVDMLLAADRESRAGGVGALAGALGAGWTHLTVRSVMAGAPRPLEILLARLEPERPVSGPLPRGRMVGFISLDEEDAGREASGGLALRFRSHLADQAARLGFETADLPRADSLAVFDGETEILVNRCGAWLPTASFIVWDEDVERALALAERLGLRGGAHAAPTDASSTGSSVPVHYETINPERARALAERYLTVPDHALRPISRAEVVISNRCNLHCRYCQRRLDQDAPEEQLAVEIWEKHFEEWAARGCRFIHFTGGEPTLHLGLGRLVRRAAGHGMTVSVTTNGTAPPELYREMVRDGLRSVHLSLDHMDEDTFDATVGVPGSFGRVLEAMRAFTEERDERFPDLKITMNTCALPDSLADLPGLLRFLLSLRPDDVKLMPIAQYHDRWPELMRRYEKLLPALMEMLPPKGFNMLRARLPMLLSPAIRGLEGRAASRCYLIREERCVDPAGNYCRCYIHLREGGRPVGNLVADSAAVQAEKLAAIAERPGDDPICRSFCADICATCNVYCDHLVAEAVAAEASSEAASARAGV